MAAARFCVMFSDHGEYCVEGEETQMWIKLVIGAIAGLIAGHWVTPGYAAWVLIGMLLGALTDVVFNTFFKNRDQTP